MTRKMGLAAMVLAGFLPSLANAAGPPVSREALIARIVSAGTHIGADERHTVVIDGCVMTTFRWRRTDDEGMILFSSATIPIGEAMILRSGDLGERYRYSEIDGKRAATLVFQMQGPDGARLEMPLRRATGAVTTPSPRKAQEPYVFVETGLFFITHEELASAAKPAAFARAFQRYKREYCSFVG